MHCTSATPFPTSRTLQFYRECLGFHIRFVHDSKQYAELETPGVTLPFAEESLAASILPGLAGGFRASTLAEGPAAFDLAFSTVDPDAAYARAVAAVAEVVEAIAVKRWAQRVGYLRDLNDVRIEIGTPVDQDHGH